MKIKKGVAMLFNKVRKNFLWIPAIILIMIFGASCTPKEKSGWADSFEQFVPASGGTVQSYLKVNLDDGTEIKAWLPQDDELWGSLQNEIKNGRIRVDVSFDGEFWRFEGMSSEIPEPTLMPLTKADYQDISLTTFAGQHYSSEDLEGNLVIINFWSSWSPNCESDIRILEQIWKEKQNDDLLILGANYVDNEGDAIKYLNDLGVTYPVGPDVESKLSTIFKIIGVPETFVIDKKGDIVSVFPGPIKYDDLMNIVNQQLDQ